MVAADGAPDYAQRLGIQKDQVVQELGWDSDTDDDIRLDIEEASGSELLDEDTDEVVDVVLLWWRDDDGDLVDALMDAITPLAEDGVIWVYGTEEIEVLAFTPFGVENLREKIAMERDSHG